MAADQAQAVLEEELAFQGETLASLNEALAVQQQDIILLKRQLQILASELRSLRGAGAGSPSGDTTSASDDKPPHY